MLINITNLKVSYENNIVISNLDLNVEENEIISIIGKSGSGKSTLLNTILGNVNYEGEIDAKIKEIGYMPQDFALFDYKTVYNNIKLPLKIKNKEIREEEIDSLLKNFEIFELKYEKIQNISGGQKSRVALIRAIINRDKLWLLDEPLSKLDYITKYEILNIIKNLQKQYGISIIYVTHDLDEALDISDRILIFKKDNYTILQNTKTANKELKSKIIKYLN